jgi:hypothetical protein
VFCGYGEFIEVDENITLSQEKKQLENKKTIKKVLENSD